MKSMDEKVAEENRVPGQGKLEFGAIDEPIEVGSGKKEDYEKLLDESTYIVEYVATAKSTWNDGTPCYSHRLKEVESGKWLYCRTSPKISKDSNLGKMFKAFGFVLEEGAKLNIKDLVGKQAFANVQIKPGRNNGEKYNSIVGFSPLPKKAVQTSMVSNSTGVNAFVYDADNPELTR